MSRVLLSSSLGDGLSTWPTALWIEISEMAAVRVVVFIYIGADLEGTPKYKGEYKGWGEKKEWKKDSTTNKDNLKNIYINSEFKIDHASLLS